MEWLAYCRHCQEEIGSGSIVDDLERKIEEHWLETSHSSICLVNCEDPLMAGFLEYRRNVWDDEEEEDEQMWDFVIRALEGSKNPLGYWESFRGYTESELEEWSKNCDVLD